MPHPHAEILVSAPPHPHLQHFPTENLREIPPEHLKPWPFPDFLDNPRSRWLQTLKRIYATPLSFPSSISPEAGLLLHALVRNIRPRAVIETGTFIGASTLWIAAALDDQPFPGVLHTFDPFNPIEPGPWRTVGLREGRRELVESYLREAGLDRVVAVHQGLTAPTISTLREAGRLPRIQLAFLSAGPSEQAILDDFHAVEPLLDTGGYILLRDTFPEFTHALGPRRLMDAIHTHARGRYQPADLYLSPVNYGLGLLHRIA